MDNSHNLKSKIEAVLFWKAEPVSIKKLASLLNSSPEEIKAAISDLEASLKGTGLTIVRSDEEVILGTATEFSDLIQQIAKEERTRDLGKAGLETLSIILYQGPISRTDIDYIRGVNSQFIIRHLMIRGLIDRIDNPHDSRSYLYKPSLELLASLGVSKVEDLPDFEKVRKEIEEYKQSTNEPSARKEGDDTMKE